MDLNDLLAQLRACVQSGTPAALVGVLSRAAPRLTAEPAVTDYLWGHWGERLLDRLATNQPLTPTEQSLLGWVPQAGPALSAYACDARLSDTTRSSAAAALGELRGRHRSTIDIAGGEPVSNSWNHDDDDNNLDDLFGPSVDDPFDGAPVPLQVQIVQLQEGESPLIGMAHGGLRVNEIRQDDHAELRLSTTLINFNQHLTVTLRELVMVLRDAQGDLLEVLDDWLETEFRHSQELLPSFIVSHEALEALDTFHILARVEVEFRARLLTAACALPDPTGPRRRLALDPSPVRAPRGLDLSASLALFIHSPGSPRLEMILEVEDRTRSTDRSRDLVVAFRDADGRLLHRVSNALHVPIGSPGYMRFELGFGDEEGVWGVEAPSFDPTRVASVEVAVKGCYVADEVLGTFQRR